jgi:hypothetical protein
MTIVSDAKVVVSLMVTILTTRGVFMLLKLSITLLDNNLANTSLMNVT